MASETLSAVRVYAREKARKLRVLAAFALTLPLFFLLDVMIGSSDLPPLEALEALVGGGSPDAQLIVWDVRLPVALAAMAAGASLGAAGALMQTVLDNPLASPYTLGVAAGAAFGAALAYVTGFAAIPWMPAATVNAFVFAFATMLLVYLLGRLRGFTAEALVLAGIAVSYAFHSLLALMEYMASEEALQAIVFWLFGSLYKVTWSRLWLEAGAAGAAGAIALIRAWRLTALRLGDDAAASMGVNPARERLLAFIAASLATAVTVSIHGVIGFVGLVAPHIARLTVGEDHRFQVPVSMLAGAVILTASDVASKSVQPGAVIPIGIVTSLIGIPFFVALLAARR